MAFFIELTREHKPPMLINIDSISKIEPFGSTVLIDGEQYAGAYEEIKSIIMQAQSTLVYLPSGAQPPKDLGLRVSKDYTDVLEKDLGDNGKAMGDSFNRWGTIYFAPEVMEKCIGWGAPIFHCGMLKGYSGYQPGATIHLLDFTVWLTFVPDCYRVQCLKIAREVFGCFRNTEGYEGMRFEFLTKLFNRIQAEVEPV